MTYDKIYLEKVFSDERMDRYFNLYPSDENKAILHYKCNISLCRAMYPCLSVFEVALRNSIVREMKRMTGREDWYAILPSTPGLKPLNNYITKASKQISARNETVTPSKITAELTLGFWVSLFNSEYELLLWKDLRRAFPFMPKTERQRKNVSSPINKFRNMRNRVFHHEGICWKLQAVEEIHAELVKALGWINKELPDWLAQVDTFDDTVAEIRKTMGWIE